MKAQHYTKETILSYGIKDRGFDRFNVGDCVSIAFRIPKEGDKSRKDADKEGDKSRLQLFEGDVICFRSAGIASTCIVRRIGANGIAVERVVPIYSPLVESIKVVHRGEVRRAKLYYLRGRIGREARVKEKVMTKEQERNAASSRRSAPAA